MLIVKDKKSPKGCSNVLFPKSWDDTFTWDIPSYFDEILPRMWRSPVFTVTTTANGATTAAAYPRCISHVDEGFAVLSFDVPGARKDDLSIEFDTDTSVTIRYKRVDNGIDVAGRYAVSVLWDKESATAALADGVLTLTMKSDPPPTKQSRRVEVK